jgi:hypothetical protein
MDAYCVSKWSEKRVGFSAQFWHTAILAQGKGNTNPREMKRQHQPAAQINIHPIALRHGKQSGYV